MPRLRRIAVVAAWLALGCVLGGANCGDPLLDGVCSHHCDCDGKDAPVKSPGEWICNIDGCCEYQVTHFCNVSQPNQCDREGQVCAPTGSSSADDSGLCRTPMDCP